MTWINEKARLVQQAIADALMNAWEPIGIKNEPAARGEYDAYVGSVYRLIASGSTAQQLAEHLARIESDEMGLGNSDPILLLPVAEELLRLNVRLDS